MKNVSIALLGCGTVGKGVVDLLAMNGPLIEEQLDTKINIKRVLIRDLNKYEQMEDLPDSIQFTTDFNDIIDDDEIEIVVEVMGSADFAKDCIEQCFLRGKSVISANKDLIADYGIPLLKLSQQHNVDFQFEASVAGGIPIVRPMYSSLNSNRIEEIIGIMNGTTNFMLTRMIEDGMQFEEALALAQKRGYAERDPSADIDGLDACRKICILASLAFGKHVYPAQVRTEGIRQVTLTDVRLAGALGGVIKLIGKAVKDGDHVSCTVAPMIVPKEHLLSNVRDVFNAILVRGDAIGDVVFYGRGAGKLPTASAVVADVIDALKEGAHIHDSLFWKPAPKLEGQLKDEAVYPWYIRVSGVSAALLPNVAGAGHTVFEADGQAAYLIDAATAAQIEEISKKIEVLGGKVELAMKKLAE